MSGKLMAGAACAALAAVSLAVVLFAAGSAEGRTVPLRAAIDRDTMRLVPDSVRVKVEVLNASGTRGVARRAMHYLRERGFDVVSVGNAPAQAESSVVIDRGGAAEWAAQAARAVGGAGIETQPDASRYLHLTIILGTKFRPPSLILYP